MELLFLGTGAADFSPLLQTPERDKTSDRSLRRSTATLMDGTVLFDCGPHTADAFRLFGAEMGKVRNLIFTHLHSDHFAPASVQKLADAGTAPLHVWFREGGEDRFSGIDGIVLHPMRVGETYDIAGYAVTALAANHDAYPLHFSVEKSGCRLFYGLDGAWLLYDTYYAMRDKHYDVMVMDTTVGDYEGDFRLGEHNSIPMLRMMMKSFTTWGVTDEHTVIVADHIARTLHKPHEELEKILAPDGVIPAYDGMILETEARS